MSRYFNPAIRELKEQQARYTPHEVRLEQIERAEKLLEEIEPEREYRYQTICERITAYRPECYPDMVIPGNDAVHDLRCFVEDLSDSVNMPVESVGEPVLTVQEVSERYNVSTKTVNRWRNRGLTSRRFVFGKRKRVGFLESTVDRFVSRHAREVHRGSQFSQLSEPEREKIIRRARRLAKFGGCPSDISRRLARRLGRSPETIRYTLKNYDREHPEAAVFPHAEGPLSESQRNDIFNRFRRGMAVEELATEYHRTRASVYRIIAEVRVCRLLLLPIDYMDSPEFHEPNAEQTIYGRPPDCAAARTVTRPPPGLPPYLASLYSASLLTREDEAYYFRKMNFLKFKAATLHNKLDPSRPRTRRMDAIEKLISRSVEIKNFLIRSNLRLVVSIAKRHIKPNTNFFEMVSDGNMSLIRAIEKFDYTKGNKFSTYASWAIMKNFARSIPSEHRLLDRFRTGNDEVFQRSHDKRSNHFHEEIVNQRQKQLIGGILETLDDRERSIIIHRFGLEVGSEPETLEQVGNRLGVTKERIRQLESRALKKLHRIAQEGKLDIPGL